MALFLWLYQLPFQEERVIEDVINEVEEIAGNSAGDNVNNEPLIQQGDFIEDFTAPEYAFAGMLIGWPLSLY